MFGVNVPRAARPDVRMKGFDGLTAEQQALLPAKIDTRERRAPAALQGLLRRSEDALHGNMPEAMFEGMFRAQCTWDAAMAWNAVAGAREARRREGDHGRAHRLRPRRLRPRRRAPGEALVRRATASVIPIPVADEAGAAPSRRSRPPTPTSSGALPPATDPLYPGVGISTPEPKSGERYKVIMVGEGLAGRGRGLQGRRRARLDGRDAPDTDKETRQPPHVGEALGRRGRLQGDARRRGADAHRLPAPAAPEGEGRAEAARRREVHGRGRARAMPLGRRRVAAVDWAAPSPAVAPAAGPRPAPAPRGRGRPRASATR